MAMPVLNPLFVLKIAIFCPFLLSRCPTDAYVKMQLKQQWLKNITLPFITQKWPIYDALPITFRIRSNRFCIKKRLFQLSFMG
jgi:hypothetical protein